MMKRNRNRLLIFLFLGLFGLNLAQYSAVQAKKPQPEDIMAAYNQFRAELTAVQFGLNQYETRTEQKDKLQALSTALEAAASMRHDFQTASDRMVDRYQLNLSVLQPHLIGMTMATNMLMNDTLQGKETDELLRKTMEQANALDAALQQVGFEDKPTAQHAYDQVQAFAAAHPPLF